MPCPLEMPEILTETDYTMYMHLGDKNCARPLSAVLQQQSPTAVSQKRDSSLVSAQELRQDIIKEDSQEHIHS